jgi:PAS domain S-box-containing protein
MRAPEVLVNRLLNLLLVEDSDVDEELLLAQLRRGGWDVECARVDTREAMIAALERTAPDLIVSDSRMPRFSAAEALDVWRERAPEVPFLIVSGTIGEEQAVALVRAGARDFLLKDRLSRLDSAVELALRDRDSGRALRLAEADRAAALAELHRSERLFQDLFASAPDATVIGDAAGRIVAANRQAESLFGYGQEELRGQAAETLVPPAARAEFARRRERFVAAPGPRSLGANEEGFLALKRDGTTFPAEISLSPVTFEDGNWIASIRDVSARRRLEEQLRQVQKMEALGRLAGGVAHDFNNVLSVILAESEALLDRLPPGDECRAGVQEIFAALDRGVALSRQLLSFSRNAAPRTQRFDPVTITRGLESMLTRLVGPKVEIDLRLGDVDRIEADPTQFEQVLINLAVNARDAMPDGGRLTIEVGTLSLSREDAAERPGAEARHYVLVTVIDTGIGMTPEVRARAFEPFFTTKEAERGTGLGLATVYTVVRQSSGFLELESAPGLGTTFRIYYPVSDASSD